MTTWKSPNPDYEAAVRESFARQGAMSLIGARLAVVRPGHVEIELPYREDLTQQHKFFHGGITSSIADTAAGYAAFSLMPPGSAILTVEFKVNFVAPAEGEKLVAIGLVKKPGRTITVCEFTVDAVRNGARKACALGLATMMALEPREGLVAG